MITHQVQGTRDTEILEELYDSSAHAPAIGTKSVLVIDDDIDLCHALSIRLAHAGLTVECAFDGTTGLQKIRESVPDLVILDLVLPRMAGFTLLHSVRMQKDIYQMPIVLLTGDKDPDVEWHALQWNVARLFHKPIDHRLLATVVQQLLK